jgi:hypothetical protein
MKVNSNKAKVLTDEQLEDLGMIKAIEKARTKDELDLNLFLEGLK